MDYQEKTRRRMIPMARDGWMFVAPLLALTVVALFFSVVVAVVIAVCAVCVGAFFRDPERAVPREPGLLLAPADGKVVGIDEMEVDVKGDGSTVRLRRVSICLTVFNVHINRAPCAGTVSTVRYTSGKFLNAFNDKSATDNENNMIWIETPGGPVGVKQIAGLVARRVLCWVRTGERLVSGQRIGLIRFGSRTEAYFPLEAEVGVRDGERVRGGLSILATMPKKDG